MSAIPLTIVYARMATAYDSLCANGANVAFGIALWGNSTTNGNDTQNDIDADYVFHTPSDLLDVL